jgi:hypothetical protein
MRINTITRALNLEFKECKLTKIYELNVANQKKPSLRSKNRYTSLLSTFNEMNLNIVTYNEERDKITIYPVGS